jgi:DNA-binding response OmpR family regulator
MLPKIDGFGVLKNIREKDPVVPVLILSAKDSSQDKIKGLKLGSDDYLEKPFDLEELLARVERMLKRSELTSQTKTKSLEGVFQFGSNSINFSSRKATTLQGDVELTAQELSLLKLFIENEGDPLSREKLLDVGWGYKKGTESRTVDNFVVRMRKYFEEDPKVPRHFQSVRSFGYKFIS